MNGGALERLAGAVADGKAGPWPETGDDPRVAGLRELDRVARAFRAADAPEPPRQVLFHWRHLEVLEPIGQGGFATVYRAWDTVLRREVALKLIDAAHDPHGDHALMAVEARRMARLRHPAILAVHGADEQDARLGIWSDLLTGRTLEAVLADEQRLSPARVLELALPLAEALSTVHRKALTHGDFKPANIMVQTGGSPVLMDFGAAREVLTETVTQGSPQVMAPELFDGARASPAADLYAFGAVLYRMLAGRYPVEADSLEALQARLDAKPKPDLRPLPRSWRPLLAALLAHDPARRPDAETLVERLRLLRTARQRRRRRLSVAAVIIALSVGLAVAGLAWREAAQQRDRARHTAATLLDVMRSPRPSRSGRNMRALDLLKDMRPRVEALLPDQPYLRARVMLELADTFLYFDQFDDVRQLGDAALAVCTACSSAQKARLQLRHHHQLTEVNLIERHMQAAEKHARAALAIADMLYPHDSAEYGYARARVGDALLAWRKLDQAGPWLKKAMRIERTGTWQDAEKQAFVRGTWLTWLITSGTMQQAETRARENVAWTEAHFGKRHSATLSAHQGLNRVLIETSQLDEAAQRLKQDIVLASDWLGATDSTTLSLRLQRASVLAEQGRNDVAIRALESIRQQVLDSAQPDQEVLLVASGNLASRYKDAKRFDQAEAMYRWVIERATASLGAAHTRTLLNRINLAELYLSRGQATKALAQATDIEKIARKHLGDKSTLTLFTRMIGGRSQSALGNYPEALRALASARDGLAAKMGPNASLSLHAEYHYASALAAAGRKDEARQRVEQLLPRMVKALGPRHAYVHELESLRKTLQ